MKTTTARINPDTLPVLIVATLMTTALGGVSFALSWAALIDVAAWAGVPSNLSWAVPVMLDAAILVYTLAVLVHRARSERAWSAWLSLAAFTTVSVIANAAHAGAVPPAWQAVIGTVVAALAPVAVLLATHTLARLIVAPVSPVSEEQTNETPDPFTADSLISMWEKSTPPTRFTVSPDRLTELAKRRNTPRPPQPRRPRMDTETRNKIIAMASEGLSTRAIEQATGVSRSTVSRTLKNLAAA